MNDIVSLLKEFGFPAIAFGLMFWMANVTIAKNTKAVDRLFVLIKMLFDMKV
jgi:hypothetical protein